MNGGEQRKGHTRRVLASVSKRVDAIAVGTSRVRRSHRNGSENSIRQGASMRMNDLQESNKRRKHK